MLARYDLKRQTSEVPLVFLHGFLGNSQDWEEVISELSSTCIAFDLPGHGASPFTEQFSLAFAEATQDLPPFHLIGYSMGGRLALQFAAQYPEKIRQLTLLSAHLGLNTEEERKNRLEKDQILANKILQTPIDEFLKEWYDQPLFRTLIASRDIRSMRRQQNREGIARALEAFSLGKQARISIEKSQLLVGEYDTAYLAHYKEIPHTVIPRAGHAAHLENPRAVARSIV